VAERERRMKEVFEKEIASDKIILRVGSKRYVVLPSILTSKKDSYFTGLLSPEIKKASKDGAELLIPRDGDVFAYVLEYLTYGKLLSTELPAAVREKLIIDADYFLLPELKAQALKVKAEVKHESVAASLDTKASVRIAGQWASTSGAAHAAYWVWNQEKLIRPAGSFTVSGDTITVTFAGVYQINVRVTHVNATNGEYNALYVNSTAIAYVYSFGQAGCYSTAVISEIVTLTAGSRLQVQNVSRGAPYNLAQANCFSIVCLD